MSAVHPGPNGSDGEKAELPRITPLDLTAIERRYMGGYHGPACRKLAALHLARLLGWTYEAIAAAFEVDPGTIKRRIARCAAELAPELEGDQYERREAESKAWSEDD